MKSWLSLLFSFFFICCVSFFYYPKWKLERTEATISWDVSGYYMYLPSVFIYKDLKKLEYLEPMREKYQFAPEHQQAFRHEKSGNFVMKYSAGQALQFLPFFAAGHLAAKILDYPADGFSRPYQLAISIGALVVSFIGLYYLRKVLLRYFSDSVTAIVILVVALATNYLNYAAIDGAMTHNFLFTLYALLLYLSDGFYKKPSTLKAILIGAICGWATLTRPTEIISLLIPLLWGVHDLPSFQARIRFIGQHFTKYVAAGVFFVLLGSVQLIYWKYASGDFFVYSYQDQTFSWLKPHLNKGMFSYRSGWLMYTPVMAFSLIGFYWLRKYQRILFPAIFLFSLLFIYICFAWDIWWYGGSLGIRAMVQAYAVLAFPMAAFTQFLKNSRLKFPVLVIVILCTVYNFWLTHQAHRGGLLVAGEMTKAYFWTIFGKNKDTVWKDARKFLDTNEEFTGTMKDVRVIYANDFEADSNSSKCSSVIAGRQSFCLNKERQKSPKFRAALTNNDADYVRATATFRAPEKEWDMWKMCQFKVQLRQDTTKVKEKYFRVFRLLEYGQTRDLNLDVALPKEPFNNVTIQFHNSGSDKEIIIDNLKLEAFRK